MWPTTWRTADSLAVLCCRRVGPPPRFEELCDRRMEWSSSLCPTSEQWSPQWICAGCARSVGSRTSLFDPFLSQSLSCCGLFLQCALDVVFSLPTVWGRGRLVSFHKWNGEIVPSPVPVLAHSHGFSVHLSQLGLGSAELACG